MSEITVKDLFGKGYDENLNEKTLMKAKKKERVMLVNSNLPFLVEFYFNRGQKDRDSLPIVYRTVSSKKFYKPLKKIAEKAIKKNSEYEVPKGMNTIIMDTVKDLDSMKNQRIQRYRNGGNTEFTEEKIKGVRDDFQSVTNDLIEILDMIDAKEIKEIKKTGIKEEYATIIARYLVPTEYMTKYNIRYYFSAFNRNLMFVIKRGFIKDENSDNFINDIGVNLADTEVIKELYDIFFKKIDREVFLVALKDFLLESRDSVFKYANKQQLVLAEALNTTVCDILEGTTIININNSKKKKEIKDNEVTKKELKHILKEWAKARIKDARKGREVARRVNFSNYSEDYYPRICKEYHKVMGNMDLDTEVHQEQMRANKNNNQNQNNNNRNNNNRK